MEIRIFKSFNNYRLKNNLYDYKNYLISQIFLLNIFYIESVKCGPTVSHYNLIFYTLQLSSDKVVQNLTQSFIVCFKDLQGCWEVYNFN